MEYLYSFIQKLFDKVYWDFVHDGISNTSILAHYHLLWYWKYIHLTLQCIKQSSLTKILNSFQIDAKEQLDIVDYKGTEVGKLNVSFREYWFE